jgi:hypothetical protein
MKISRFWESVFLGEDSCREIAELKESIQYGSPVRLLDAAWMNQEQLRKRERGKMRLILKQV